jgi:hypothetical protein
MCVFLEVPNVLSVIRPERPATFLDLAKGTYLVPLQAAETFGPALCLICCSHSHAERVSMQSRTMSRAAESLSSRARSKNSIQSGTLLRECASSSEVAYCRTSASEQMKRAKSPNATYDKLSRSHSSLIGNAGMALRSSEMAVSNVKPMCSCKMIRVSARSVLLSLLFRSDRRRR